ncbi:MAG TPA: hypothetical protein VKV40_06085 [Ktedonobacteraceae bacterium]|nr:hypothetical protein [Ktedonobacteraceae bacterium]
MWKRRGKHITHYPTTLRPTARSGIDGVADRAPARVGPTVYDHATTHASPARFAGVRV